MSYIATYTGQIIELDNPNLDNIYIEDIAVALSNINRFSGHTLRPYSVAEHSYRMSYLTDDKELALAYLMHDAAEAYTGDITTPIKNRCPYIKELETRFNSLIRERFGVTIDVMDDERVHHADKIMLSWESRDLLATPEAMDIHLGEYVLKPDEMGLPCITIRPTIHFNTENPAISFDTKIMYEYFMLRYSELAS